MGRQRVLGENNGETKSIFIRAGSGWVEQSSPIILPLIGHKSTNEEHRAKRNVILLINIHELLV